jgi:hypothetical protein
MLQGRQSRRGSTLLPFAMQRAPRLPVQLPLAKGDRRWSCFLVPGGPSAGVEQKIQLNKIVTDKQSCVNLHFRQGRKTAKDKHALKQF